MDGLDSESSESESEIIPRFVPKRPSSRPVTSLHGTSLPGIHSLEYEVFFEN